MNDAAVPPQLIYPFPDPPTPGETIDVAPGIKWLRMPIPGPLGHINLWLLADGDAWTVVDCGLPREETIAYWEHIFATALGGRPVTRLVVTHFHPDHFGLCAWFAERWGVRPWMTLGEWLMARGHYAPPFPADAAHRLDFYRTNGISGAALDTLADPGAAYRRNVAAPPAFHRMRAGVAIAIGGQDWIPIIGRGHSPEHACLWAPGAGVIVGGDILLPRISPNVSVWPAEPDQNPLADFLESLDGFAAVPNDALVLPAHGLPYRGVRQRIADLKAHHAERLDRLVVALESPRAAPELFSLMFKRAIGPDNMALAIGETLAHLHLLEAQGRVARRRGPDGAWRFRSI